MRGREKKKMRKNRRHLLHESLKRAAAFDTENYDIEGINKGTRRYILK